MKHARGSSIIVPISGPQVLGVHLLDHVLDPRAQDRDLLLVGDEREHDLDLRQLARPLAHGARGGHDRLHLHVVDLRGDDPEPRAARAEHRVGLLERVHAVERALQPPHVARALVPRPLELDGEVLGVGQELVQRRVEQADRHRQVDHRLEQPLEVLGLQREQLGERGVAVLARLAHDHRLHLRLAVGGHEHVLRPAQADPLGAELARLARVLGRVGVRAHAEPAELVRPARAPSRSSRRPPARRARRRRR